MAHGEGSDPQALSKMSFGSKCGSNEAFLSVLRMTQTKRKFFFLFVATLMMRFLISWLPPLY
jgi:hypothetical protein